MAYRVFQKVFDVVVPQEQTRSSLVPVACPTTGAVHKVSVRQIAGTNTAATFYLVGFDVSQLSDFNTNAPILLDHYSIFPKLTVPSGQIGTYFSDHGHRYARFDNLHSHDGLLAAITVDSAPTNDLTYRVILIISTNDG